jgi:dihydrofolate reductase / thymidylate synthase
MVHFSRVTKSATAIGENDTRTTDTMHRPIIESTLNDELMVQNAVIMGRRTWESIPLAYRPLPGRMNVVLSRQAKDDYQSIRIPNLLMASSLENAMSQLSNLTHVHIDQVFVIGGAQVYQQAIAEGYVNRIVYTEVSNLPDTIQFDSYFPQLLDQEWKRQNFCFPTSDVNKENENEALSDIAAIHEDAKTGIRYQFVEYIRKTPVISPASSTNMMPITDKLLVGHATNVEEQQYLDLCRSIMETGIKRGDRTGTGTLSLFGTQMRFSLRDGTLPLLTTKRTFWRGVAEELLWFISVGVENTLFVEVRCYFLPYESNANLCHVLGTLEQGNTNANSLADKKVHIWDGNGSREFLDQRGLGHREVGDLGPVYGFQWRHFGAKYIDMHTDYAGQGVDQLADCIDKIKHHPEDRRIILSAWNPSDLSLMALPPCHMFCQFYVSPVMELCYFPCCFTCFTDIQMEYFRLSFSNKVDIERNEVSCQMYQRSADMGLGVPFNIASYALLTHMIAHVTNRKAGDFVHTIGDAHVYLNHVNALQEQITRKPLPFPKIKINPQKTNIDDFAFEDFEVIGYHPHKTIKMEMAV